MCVAWTWRCRLKTSRTPEAQRRPSAEEDRWPERMPNSPEVG